MDVTAILGAVGSLKSAAEIAGGLMSIRDQAVLQGKVIELQSKILAAQSDAISAQNEYALMAQKIRDLKDEIAKYATWDKEKSRYRLTEIKPGFNVYLLIEEESNGEAIHAICPSCYNLNKKSILQNRGVAYATTNYHCHACKFDVHLDYGNQFLKTLPPRR